MGGARDNGTNENRRPDDIRRFLSPSRNDQTPSRRRRIVTSSDSEDEQSSRPAVERSPLHERNGNEALHQHVAQHQDVVQLSSSDDDSMYIPLPRAATAARTEQPNQPERSRSSTTAARRKSQPNATPTRRLQPANTARVGSRRPRSTPSRDTFAGEAEEASSDGGESQESECAESDTHGADLYRQAMASCRNANAARTQLRAETTNCRVCAKFAAFLQHFL